MPLKIDLVSGKSTLHAKQMRWPLKDADVQKCPIIPSHLISDEVRPGTKIHALHKVSARHLAGCLTFSIQIP